MFYFYCPNCGNSKEVERLPRGTMANIRDGFGGAIYHYECDNCHNLDAGFMQVVDNTQSEVNYIQSVIGIYQGIRTRECRIEEISRNYEMTK